MNLLINLLIGAVVAYIAKLLLEFIGVPEPLPWIVALLVLLFVAFGGHRFGIGGR